MTLHSPARLMPLFMLGSVVTLVLLLMAVGQDARRPWKVWQKEYLQTERVRRAGGKAAGSSDLRMGIRQVQVPELGRVDRCTTCHLAVSNPQYVDGAQPLKSHPPLPGHTLEVFGCTVCHRGNGLATNLEAHEGMLPLTHVSSSCLACHELYSLSAQPRLQAGRRLFESQGCLACHQLEGKGGLAAPALDGVGMKYSLKWIAAHLQDPAKMSPGSAMPPVRLPAEDLETLTVYVMGLIPPVTDSYFASRRVLPTPEAGRRLYFQRGCIGCHPLEGVGGDSGPDLTHPEFHRSEARLRFFLSQPQNTPVGGGMPHPDLRPDELDALLGFLLEIQRE